MSVPSRGNLNPFKKELAYLFRYCSLRAFISTIKNPYCTLSTRFLNLSSFSFSFPAACFAEVISLTVICKAFSSRYLILEARRLSSISDPSGREPFNSSDFRLEDCQTCPCSLAAICLFPAAKSCVNLIPSISVSYTHLRAHET